MRPAVITFYSYKGGVGRTILAANMAFALARRGKTLLWDLDVEAPGLHRINALRNTAAVKAGFFDWLIEWQKNQSPALGAADFKHFDKLLYPTSFTDLDILPAHGDTANPAALYFAIDWAALLGVNPPPGKKLIDDLLVHLGEQGYQHVLIDSRTGLTDLGGLLAGVLPDATVLVGGYGAQNITGLSNVRKAFLANTPAQKSLRGDQGLLRLFPVASPIPQDDQSLVAVGREAWAKAFELELAAVCEIPFDPELPFSEALFIRQPEKKVAKEYEKLARDLSAFVDTLFSDRQAAQNQIDQRPDIFDRDDFDPRGSRGPGSRAAQGKRFEERVADLLRLLGYSVEPEQVIDSNRVDLLARIDSGLDQFTYFVECKDHQAAIGQDVVDKLGVWLTKPEARAMHARGMVVAKAFSPMALKSAKDLNISAFTPADLERRLLDFDRYLATEIADFEAMPLATSYVTQRANGDKAGKEAIDDLETHGLAWANGTGSRLWVLLGDYGTGKTAYTRKLGYELAKKAKNDSNAPVPLRISLREFPNKVTLDDLVAERWLQATGQRKDPRVLLHLVQRGRIVLLFDAFDEMGIAAAGRSVVEQFRMLVRITGQAGESAQGNRVLVTCREQFFKDHGEAITTAAGNSDRLATSALQGITAGFDGAIDTVAPFDEAQIKTFLARRMGAAGGADAWGFLQQHDLVQLGDRPQLLDIIIQSLPDLKLKQASTGAAINVGGLYATYTNKWLDDFKPTERQSTSQTLRDVLEELAHSLWQRLGNRLHYGDLFALIKDLPKLRGKLDPNQLDVELRTAAFLSRTPDGMYGFSHRSFLEFFLARRIQRAACVEGAETLGHVLAIPRLSREVCSFVHDLTVQLDAKSGEAMRMAINSLLTDAPNLPPLAARVNALILGHYCSQQPGGQGGYIPTGAMLAGADLSELNLAGLVAPGIDLQAARLMNVNLQGAKLAGALMQNANLTQAVLSDADLSHAQLQNVDATECVASHALFTSATAQNSTWLSAQMQDCDVDGTDFTRADLRLGQLARATGQPVLEDALLFGAVAAGAVGFLSAAPQLTWPALADLQLSPSPCPLGAVTTLAFSPDGKTLASGGNDSTVRLWDAQSGKALKTLDGHSGWVNTLAFSPNGKALASGGDDNALRLWDAQSGTALKTLSAHGGFVMALAFSSDGKTLAIGRRDGVLWLLQSQSGDALKTLTGHSGRVTTVAFSPDGKTLASGGYDNTLRLWGAQTGEALKTLDGHSNTIKTLAFSPDGKTLASGGFDNTLRLWDAQSGRALKTLDCHSGWVNTLAFSPDGKTLASGSDDNSLQLWDARSGKALKTIAGHSGSVNTLAFSADGKTLASGGGDYTLRLWDAQSGKAMRTLECDSSTVMTLAFSPNGKTVASGGSGNLTLWDPQIGQPLIKFEGFSNLVNTLAFSPNGETIGGAGYGGILTLWDAQSGRAIWTARGESMVVNTLAFSPDGKTLASGGYDKTVRLWDVRSGKVLKTLEAHTDWINSLAFSPDGETLASAGGDKTLLLWDARSGKALKTVAGHSSALMTLAFSPNSETLVIGGYDKTLLLRDARSGKALKTFAGHSSAVMTLAFSPNGKTLASGGDDGTVRLWDAQSAKALNTFEGHSGTVATLAFSPDGKTLASGGRDRTLRLWANGQEQLRLVSGAVDGVETWLSLDFRTDPRGLWRGAGPLLDQLQYRDMGEQPQPWPWLPRDWYATDLPELKAPD